MPKKKDNEKKEKKYVYPKKENDTEERAQLKKVKKIPNLKNADSAKKNKYKKRNWKQYLEEEK